MKDLSIQANRKNKTPFVDFKTSGELCIEGRSLPENTIEFYSPVIQWIKHLKETLPPKITLTIKLEYFNTSTSQILLNIFKLLDKIQESGTTDVCIIWQYHTEDEEMYEAGSCYQSISKVTFLLAPFTMPEPSISLS
jgi:hypothetical protein